MGWRGCRRRWARHHRAGGSLLWRVALSVGDDGGSGGSGGSGGGGGGGGPSSRTSSARSTPGAAAKSAGTLLTGTKWVLLGSLIGDVDAYRGRRGGVRGSGRSDGDLGSKGPGGGVLSRSPPRVESATAGASAGGGRGCDCDRGRRPRRGGGGCCHRGSAHRGGMPAGRDPLPLYGRRESRR